MNRFLLFLGLFSFLISITSCDTNKISPNSTPILPPKKTPVVSESVDSAELEIEKLAKSLITNRNAVKKLTEYGDSNKEKSILIYTNLGNVQIKLYTNTPLHRANFVMLAKKKFYDNTLFYRVIDNFMIQGGNSDDSEITDKLNVIGGYRIPNEIKTNNIHKKGAIAMAVATEEQSLGKKSSSINFYIIEGQTLPSYYFTQKEEQGKKYSAYQKEVYSKTEGAPHLDGDYTVFGEMVSGFSTLSKISGVKVDKYNWPRKKVVIDSIRAF